MPTLRTALTLCALFGLQAASAQTCTRKVDYPMAINHNQPLALVATELGFPNAHARFGAVLAIDAAMKADLDASVAAGCTQEVRNFIGNARLSTAGYCNAAYYDNSVVYGYRPSTGLWWYLASWSEQAALPTFGGEVVNTYRHKNAAPVKQASRARVGDEVWVDADVNLEVNCFGSPDSIADRGEASYDWGTTPAPVVRIWLP